MIQKVFSWIYVFIFIIFFFSPLVAVHAQEPNLESIAQQLQQKIKDLEQQIATLQKQLEATKTAEVRVNEISKFTKTPQRGMTGDEVKELQGFLKQFSDIYPEGLVTGYFGPLTENAVKKFQEKNGVESVGVVGPITRGKLNELITVGAGQSGNIPPGLLVAPGLEGKTGTSTAITTPSQTPEGTIPATPAEPATPSSGTGTPATPVVPATPAQPSPPLYQDITPPVISNVQATNITESSATITWTTNESASSGVFHALGASITASSTIGASNVISHSVILVGLFSDTTHHYIVVSTDASGNTATSSEQFFITISPPPPPPTSYEERIIRITTNPADQERPAISGNKIVWSDKRNESSDIYMYDLIANTETQISSSSGDEGNPSISGNYIVYSGAGGIYLYDITNSTTTFIGSGTQPRIDGNNIVYQKFPSPRDIRLYNISTGQTSLISTNGESWPYISGSDIVYQGGSALYHYDLISGMERQLFSTTVPFRGSVSGGRIAYDERRDGLGGQDHDVYVYTLSTNVEKELTSQKGGELGNISISGNRVVWTDTDDYNIYLYDLSTNQLIQLTAHPSQQYHSYLDGNRVVWADYRNGNFDIYLLEL